jgi:hypothetical protein
MKPKNPMPGEFWAAGHTIFQYIDGIWIPAAFCDDEETAKRFVDAFELTMSKGENE